MILRTRTIRPTVFDFGSDFESWWSRADALRDMGLNLQNRSTGKKEFEEKECGLLDQAELQYLEEMTRPARLQAQAARLLCNDKKTLLANAASERKIEADGSRAGVALAAKSDLQAGAIGLPSITLTPRILAQRPIYTRVPRG
jgi:hypothetical protein